MYSTESLNVTSDQMTMHLLWNRPNVETMLAAR